MRDAVFSDAPTGGNELGARGKRVSGVVWLVVLAVVVLALPIQSAWAGKRSMIPPGHEQTIRSFVERALAREGVSIQIERDRIRVDPGGAEGPRFVIFHPEIEPSEEIGLALAAGVVVECGTKPAARRCDGDELAAARPIAEALARERDPLTNTIWTVEESVTARSSPDRGPQPRGIEATIDQLAAALALALTLTVLVVRARRGRHERVGWSSAATRAGLVALALLGFVGLTWRFTSLWPLHEHASFVARSDCALDELCREDPIGAWSPTTFHVLAPVLRAIPYTLDALAWISVGWSLIVMVLVWALTRTLLIELGRPQLAWFGAAASLLMLVVHPVHWRLAGSASFWPYVLACALGAALAGLWASREAHAGWAAIGWTLAALLLAFACGGNIVLVSLTPLGLIAPLCWTRVPGRQLLRRAMIVGVVPVVGFALVHVGDLIYALDHALERAGVRSPWTLLAHLDWLLFDARVSALVWAPMLVLAPAWVVRRLRERAPDLGRPAPAVDESVAETEPLHPVRLLAPLIYAGVVPHLFLGVAAGDVIGSGYPVGFLNHHWELVFCAVAVGLGTAWLIGAVTPWATQRWPTRPPAVALGLTAIPAALGLLLAPLAHEGWQLATGEGVVERELAALQNSFAELPEHDRLVLAPRIMAPIGEPSGEFDPIEVNFPVGAYQRALEQRGLEPALVLDIDRFVASAPPPNGSEFVGVPTKSRTLIYVGSALRSFQPPEIRAGLVPDGLERPELTRLRDRFSLQPVLEFELEAAQHPANSLRLGADRSPTTTLGFYWLVPRVD